MSARTFSAKPAVLSRVALRLAFCGPTGSGKSLSAHIFAESFSRVDGKPVFLVTTEGPSKGLMYAPRPGQKANPPKSFDFSVVHLDAPYRSLDYLAAMQYCEDNGAGTIIVDHGSFEHDSVGGYLDLHEKEVDRMLGDKKDRATQKERAKYWAAWIKPGNERHAMLNGMDKLTAHIIWTFRAKEKLKIVTGQEPIDLGWQAIAGDEVLAEFPIRLLLPPGCDGVPNFRPEMPGEKLFNRIPIHLREGFFEPDKPINFKLGEKLIKWANGELGTGQATAAVDPERQALLDKILAHLKAKSPGDDEASKQARQGDLYDLLGTTSWKKVANELPIEKLQEVVKKIEDSANG